MQPEKNESEGNRTEEFEPSVAGENNPVTAVLPRRDASPSDNPPPSLPYLGGQKSIMRYIVLACNNFEGLLRPRTTSTTSAISRTLSPLTSIALRQQGTPRNKLALQYAYLLIATG